MSTTTDRARATEPLREEHRELLPNIHDLAAVAAGVGEVPDAEVRARVDEAYEFLAFHLVPHALAEDAVLYPAVERAMGAPGATDTMRRDHVEVRRYIEELAAARDALGDGAPGPETARELRRILYGLHAMVRLHFAKEEELYLETLDAALDAGAAAELFEALEAAAGEAKRSVGAGGH